MKELQELIKDLQLQMNYCCYDAEMLNKLSGVWEVVHKLADLSQNLQQCDVSGSLPPDWSIKNILHSVYADTLNKWSSHQEVDEGLNEYVSAIKSRFSGGNDR